MTSDAIWHCISDTLTCTLLPIFHFNMYVTTINECKYNDICVWIQSKNLNNIKLCQHREVPAYCVWTLDILRRTLNVFVELLTSVITAAWMYTVTVYITLLLLRSQSVLVCLHFQLMEYNTQYPEYYWFDITVHHWVALLHNSWPAGRFWRLWCLAVSDHSLTTGTLETAPWLVCCTAGTCMTERQANMLRCILWKRCKC